MDRILLKSFSKVNIGLKIFNKREDGYHNIHTVFQEIDFHDNIILKKRNAGCYFTSNVDWLSSDKSNLCVKAWQCLVDRFDIAGIEIKLQKNIPPGSGLGGGSSNAASVLKGLLKLYNLNISSNDLLRIGSSIGADVPFFIKGGCQIGSGIGDQLIKVENSIKKTFLLVMPEFHISTKTTFEKFKNFLDYNQEKVNFANFIEKDKFLFKFFENDFETIIVPAYPEIGQIKKKLLNQGAVFSSLSGTGSTVYGVFDDEAKAISAESLFKVHYKTCIAHPVKNMLK
tara:strand:+ start:517 stop:1368 length:852 start_codon:yes stop_codon:yes gene_type:complete